jgi:hypothetical protein
MALDHSVKLYEQWYQGCKTKEERVKRYESITSNLGSLQVLQDLLKKRLEITQEQVYSEKNYADASWSQKQADLLGQMRVYSEMLKLLKFLDE